MVAESPIRVLHAEDDPPFADMCKAFLERDEDIEVVTATDPEEAVVLFDDGAFDCVVSDHDMPGMTGTDLLRAVRARDPDVPFILFTGKGSEEVAADAIAAGVTGYLQKGGPDTLRLLRNRIHRAVSEYRVATTYDEYRTVVESLNDPVYVLDGEGRFTYVNDAFCELTGYDRETVLDCGPSLIKSASMVDRAEHELGRILSGAGPESTVFEIEITTADGEIVVCEDHMGVLPFEGETFEGSAGVLRNVSHEHALERRSAFLEEMVDSLGAGVAVYTADGRFEYVNDAYASLLGYDADDLLGMTVPEVNPAVDADRFADYWASFEAGETREHETVHERADGTTVPVRTVTTCRDIHGTRYHFGTVYSRETD